MDKLILLITCFLYGNSFYPCTVFYPDFSYSYMLTALLEYIDLHNLSPMKPTINSSKFCSSKYRVGHIHQSFFVHINLRVYLLLGVLAVCSHLKRITYKRGTPCKMEVFCKSSHIYVAMYIVRDM